MPWLADLPRPTRDELTIYCFGPGVGESLLVALPDGKWLAIDACRQGGVTIPLEVLRAFGIETIDLAIVTHPDLDHIQGFAELVEELDVAHLWRYPSGTLKDLLAAWSRQSPGDPKLQELFRAHEVMDDYAARNRSVEASLDTRDWPASDDSSYRVTAIAPCPADTISYRLELESLVARSEGTPKLHSTIVDYLQSLTKSSPYRPSNGLSLAVTITWNDVRVLFGGDVEAPGTPHRGWSGILEVLRDDGRLDLVTDLTTVKVAHHGSRSAFSPEAWRAHASTRPVPYAMITPFRAGSNPPPHMSVLKELRRYVETLGVTAAPKVNGAWTRIEESGWASTGPGDPTDQGCWIALSIGEDGHAILHEGSAAARFVQSKSR